MSQSYFSLGFLSQNSLQKNSLHFVDIRVFIVGCVWNAKSQVSNEQGVLATRPRDWNESRANCLAKLEVLSCSATAGMTLQLPCMLHTCAIFGDLTVMSQLRDPITRPFLMHTLKLFFTLSHTLPLHDSHLNTGFLNAELQVNLAWNKANKMIK